MQKNAEIFFLPRFSQFLFQISIPNYHVELSHCAISNFSFSFFLLSKLVFVPGERFNCKLLIPFFFSFFFWKRTRTLVCSLRPRYETTTKINLKTINLFRSPCVTRSPGIPLTLLNVRNVWHKVRLNFTNAYMLARTKEFYPRRYSRLFTELGESESTKVTLLSSVEERTEGKTKRKIEELQRYDFVMSLHNFFFFRDKRRTEFVEEKKGERNARVRRHGKMIL